MNQNKHKLSIFSVLFIGLTISACGQEPAEKDEPKKPEEQITTVSFNNISNTIGLNAKAVTFVDKMRAQEENSSHPYRFTALDGNDNIDAKDEMSNSDDKINRPIKISWDKTGLNYESINLVLSKDNSFADSKVYKTRGDFVELDNLFRNTTYYYRLENDGKTFKSQAGNFTTGDYVRSINLNGDDTLPEQIRNVRDEGGYMTVFGVRTNQGLIYRGGELNIEGYTEGTTTHKKNVDDTVLAKQNDFLHIGAEIDLRTDSETNNATASCLGTDVNYLRKTFASYASFISDPDNGKEGTLKAVFDVLANADKKPVYFHCKGGADRTGTLAFFLNGMLGVSLTDLYIDFELTTQTGSTFRSHLTKSQSYDFPGMLKAIKALDYYDANGTICDFCYNFLNKHGVSTETLEKIRTIMIPGYQTGMAQVND